MFGKFLIVVCLLSVVGVSHAQQWTAMDEYNRQQDIQNINRRLDQMERQQRINQEYNEYNAWRAEGAAVQARNEAIYGSGAYGRNPYTPYGQPY